jgi:predicted aspartyl protease
MGRIVSSVTINNISDSSKTLRCDALVDTGTSFLVLPDAWRDRLGDLEIIGRISLETATQESVEGDICGPVRIQIEGFRPIYNEVLFVEMKPEDGIYEPLIGYIVLEQSQAAVDTLGHRLIPIKHMDLKSLSAPRPITRFPWLLLFRRTHHEDAKS